MSKELAITLVLLRVSVIRQKKSRHSLTQSVAKLQTIVTLSTAFPRALAL